jgi:hypothetical protein
MSVREYLNNNSAVATILAVVVLVVALGIIVWSNKGPGGGDFQVYFYDLNTQTISAQSPRLPSPYDVGGGTTEYFDGTHGSGVRATIYVCGEADDISPGMSREEIEAAGGKIVSLHRYAPQMLAAQQKLYAGEEVDPGTMYNEMTGSGMLISNVEGRVWVSEESEQGFAMMSDVHNLCGGSPPTLALP